jgi:hypothetical protein
MKMDSVKKVKSVLLCLGAILAVVIVVVLVVKGVFLFKKLASRGGHEVTTVSKASLEKVLDISEFSTLEYTYNSIVTVYDEQNEKAVYYVAYEGTVDAGIDFSKIEVSEPDEDNKITITLPEVEVQGTYVDAGSLDYIFVNSKYETETVSQEAYKKCKEDLEQKANETVDLEELAKDNAKTSVQALIQPWIDQLEEGYTVDIQ